MLEKVNFSAKRCCVVIKLVAGAGVGVGPEAKAATVSGSALTQTLTTPAAISPLKHLKV